MEKLEFIEKVEEICEKCDVYLEIFDDMDQTSVCPAICISEDENGLLYILTDEGKTEIKTPFHLQEINRIKFMRTEGWYDSILFYFENAILHLEGNNEWSAEINYKNRVFRVNNQERLALLFKAFYEKKWDDDYIITDEILVELPINSKTIDIPDGVERILLEKCIDDNSPQKMCTEIIIPSSVKEISDRSFDFYNELKKVIIKGDSKLLSIPSECFYACKKLETINIPDSVLSIKKGAFRYTKITRESLKLPRDCIVDEEAFDNF